VLLAHANQVVALDRLIEELWGEEPPAQAWVEFGDGTGSVAFNLTP